VINYTVVANEGEQSRSAKITVEYGNQSFEVVVTQDGKPAEKPISPPIITLHGSENISIDSGSYNGSISLCVESALPVPDVFASSSVSWLTVQEAICNSNPFRPIEKKVNGTKPYFIKFKAQSNNSPYSRVGRIVITCGNSRKTVVVTQPGNGTGLFHY
jgi:hypothetical protein